MPSPEPPFDSPDPEFELLLRCLRGTGCPDSGLGTNPPIDANRFLAFCRRHAVRPLVHRALFRSQWRGVPPEVRAELNQFTLRNALRNTALVRELLRLVAAFRAEGIPVAAFKGPLLAQHVYGALALREFLDIDLIVPEPDYPRAEAVLADMGFLTLDRDEQQEDYLAESGQASFRRPGERFSVDLHWKLAPLRLPFPFPEDEIWSQLQMLPLGGGEIPTLGWNHQALFMAFHGTKELWRSLKWICDFAELTRCRPDLDWAELRARAAGAHCESGLLLAARLCDRLGLPSPPELRLPDSGAHRVASLAERTLLRLPVAAEVTELSRFTYALAVAERFRDRFRIVLTLLTTRTVSDFELIRLPRGLRGLYYVIRPFRLAVKAARQILSARVR